MTNPINNELNMLRPTLINHLLNSKNQKKYKKSEKIDKTFELRQSFWWKCKSKLSLAFLISGLNSEPSLLNGPKGEDIGFLDLLLEVQNCI